MASSMDFKDLFERYQRVGAKNGISIVNYCKINGLRRVKYIADVLRKLISGETDYIALLPMNIAKNHYFRIQKHLLYHSPECILVNLIKCFLELNPFSPYQTTHSNN